MQFEAKRNGIAEPECILLYDTANACDRGILARFCSRETGGRMLAWPFGAATLGAVTAVSLL